MIEEVLVNPLTPFSYRCSLQEHAIFSCSATQVPKGKPLKEDFEHITTQDLQWHYIQKSM